MKSKLTKMKPKELGNLKFKEAKMIVKKDLELLNKEGEEASTFFIITEFDYDDKKAAPLFVIGELKGEWKKFAREKVKPPHKNSSTGTCSISSDGETLTLNIKKGKAKPKAIEKALSKGSLKIIPTNITNLVFTEETIEDSKISSFENTEEETANDDIYRRIVEQSKEYKNILEDDTTERFEKIDFIENLIANWQAKFQTEITKDAVFISKSKKINQLKEQLNQERVAMQLATRTEIQSIQPIEEDWSDYKSSGNLKAGIEHLSDLEYRIDTLTDIEADITAWNENNPPPLANKEKDNKKILDAILVDLSKQVEELKQQLPDARKAHTKLMLTTLSEASDKRKKELAEDPVFLLEMARTIPVAEINKAREFLGLDPIIIEKDEEGKIGMAGSEWNDPEIEKAFSTFEKVVTFSADVVHRNDPEIHTIKIEFPAGATVQKLGENPFKLGGAYAFDLISEDKVTGRVEMKAGKDTYYGQKTDSLGISRFEKTVLPLFNGKPSKNDIYQGGLGDCYLLAAVTSLVNKDPQAIMDMMLDRGDRVTVRLFHITIDAKTKKKQFKARYFDIEKSVVQYGTNTDQYAKQVLWVQILEKAYAAGNFTGLFSNYVGDLTKEGKYKSIESGLAAFSYEFLTGREATIWFHEPRTPKDFVATGLKDTERSKGNSGVDGVNLPWGTNELSALGNVKVPNDYKKLTSYNILGKDIGKVKLWFQFVKKNSINQLFKREYDGVYNGQITIDDFDQLFQGKMKDADEKDIAGLPSLDAACAKDMLDWIKSEKLYPGKRGAGVYSALQLDMFTKIKDALANKELVSLGSKKKVGRDTDGVGHSGGEALSGGLAGGHGYTIINTREPKPLKELLLRNPWGKEVQENIKVADRIKEIEPILPKILQQEAGKYKRDVFKVQTERKAAKIAYDNEDPKNVAKKAQLKKDYEDLLKEDNEMVIRYQNLLKGHNPEGWEGKFTYFQTEYDKTLKYLQKLRRIDPNALISKQVKQSKQKNTEDGEFWLLLDDLTHRFKRVYVG